MGVAHEAADPAQAVPSLERAERSVGGSATAVGPDWPLIGVLADDLKEVQENC